MLQNTNKKMEHVSMACAVGSLHEFHVKLVENIVVVSVSHLRQKQSKREDKGKKKLTNNNKYR